MSIGQGSLEAAGDPFRSANHPGRYWQGLELPREGTWRIDPTRSTLTATIRHAVLSRVSAKFKLESGEISVADNVMESAVRASVDVTSMDSGDKKRDLHLLDADYLDVANHPTIVYDSTTLAQARGQEWSLEGTLSILDRKRPVHVGFQLIRLETGRSGLPEMLLKAHAEIVRDEFGLTWNQILETGGLVLGKAIGIDCSITAVLDHDREN